jgi:hypothetical protein
LLLISKPDGVVLALEDGLLDKFDGMDVFGFYLVHRATLFRNTRYSAPVGLKASGAG